jgi:hypothetical protein
MMPPIRQLASGLRQALDWAQQLGKHQAYMMRTLPNDLQIVYAYQGDKWRLTLRREDRPVSEDEIESIRTAFDVPEAAQLVRSSGTDQHPVSRRRIKFYRAEFLWREQIAHLPRAASTFAPVEGSDAAVWGG